ncbi:hypothetical protein GCM10025879_17840 [Leuconostoc litchii]|nr:hypothetical protein GCM10025879_17840 [Leuconostoc litchii]
MALFVFALFPVLVKADNSTTGSGLSFTVKTNLPDNQIDKKNDFYQLKMTPGQKQTVTATVYNTTNKPQTIKINVQTASTSINGTIDYSKALTNWDKSLKYKLNEIVSYPKRVTVPAGKSQDVSFAISMPEDSYKGILLGGITFNQVDDNQSEPSSNTTNIQNKCAYAVAMILKESDDQVIPNINLQSVKAGQNNGHNVIDVKLQNDQSLLMSNVKVVAKVYSAAGKKPVYTTVKSDMQIAPNSQFKYPVSLQGTPMQPGKYRLELAVTGTAYKDPKTWHFTKNFTIKRQEAASFNQSDVDVSANTNNHLNIFIIIGIILFIIIVILFVLLVLRRKNAKKKS